MKRREFIVCLAGIAQALLSPTTCAAAQAAAKVYKVGILNAGNINAAIRVAIEDGIVRVLAELGYSTSRNLVIESRAANNQPERLPKLAEELVESGVDVIVTISYPAARAAKDATTTVPIVAYGAADPRRIWFRYAGASRHCRSPVASAYQQLQAGFGKS